MTKIACSLEEYREPKNLKIEKLLLTIKRLFSRYIDTGVHCNVILKCTVSITGYAKKLLQKFTANLVDFGGHKLNTISKVSIECQ